MAKTDGHARVPLARAGASPSRDATLLDTDIVYRLASESTHGRHQLDQAGQGGVGLVELQQHLRRAVPRRREHRHLQALHRLRGRERPRVRDPRRGLVQARRPDDADARHRHGGDRGPRAGEEGRPGDVGDLEDARPADGAGARPVREVGREGHQGRLHAARGPVDGQLLRADGAARRPSGSCSWTSTAPTSRPGSTARIRTS